jgi:intein-encoded DNA endonuclease-like protein
MKLYEIKKNHIMNLESIDDVFLKKNVLKIQRREKTMPIAYESQEMAAYMFSQLLLEGNDSKVNIRIDGD